MASIQPAQLHHFPAITDLNVEAYREYAAYLNAETWTTMLSNLRPIETLAQQMKMKEDQYAKPTTNH
jgi:hypothetical protein